ncbi:MAG: EamA family transporter, partial [Gemmatimonadales bacterium]
MTDSLESTPKRWQIAVAFAAVYLIWGSTYLGIAFAIETLPPLLMTGTRFVAAGLVMYAFARLRGAPRPEPAHWRSATVLGVLFFLCGNGAVTWVEQWMSSGLTAVVVAMVTAWTVLLEWLGPGGKRPGPAVLAGLVTGFFGVALLLLPGRVTGPKDVNLPGAITLMVSSFLWAVGSIYSKKATLPRHIGLTSGMQMLVGGGLLLLAGTLAGEWPQLHWQSVS